MKKTLISILLAGLCAGGLPVLAQGDGPHGGPSDRGGAGYTLPPDVEIPAEVQALRDSLIALRDDLQASRQAVLEALPDNVTVAERAAALEAWRAANEGSLADVRELSAELRAELEALGIIGSRDHADVPEEIVDARTAMNDLQRSLAESRREALAALGDDATAEDRRLALADWREDNAADLATLDELQTVLQTWMRENRPDRGRRHGLSAEVRNRLAAFREAAGAMKQRREQLRQDLANAGTPQARQELIRQYREEQRSLMQERKDLKRQERLAGETTGGDRRPGG